jgi:hypothetical protein
MVGLTGLPIRSCTTVAGVVDLVTVGRSDNHDVNVLRGQGQARRAIRAANEP